MAPAQLIIFDCDGVLVDSERLSHQVLCAMLAEMGVVLRLEAAVLRFMGTSLAECVRRIEALVGRPVHADFTADFERRTFAAFAVDLVAVPGVLELLASLPVPYCVASNGPHSKMRFTLGATGLLPRFTGRMFSADDVAHPKPAPDLFLHAARCLSTEPAACLVVEDSPLGVAAARAAGMTVVGFAAMTPAGRLQDAGAHAVVSSMTELAQVIRSTTL